MVTSPSHKYEVVAHPDLDPTGHPTDPTGHPTDPTGHPQKEQGRWTKKYLTKIVLLKQQSLLERLNKVGF